MTPCPSPIPSAGFFLADKLKDGGDSCVVNKPGYLSEVKRSGISCEWLLAGGGVSSGPRNLSRGRNKSWKNGDVSACPHTLERETLRKGTNVCVGLLCSPERTRGRGLKRGDRSSGSPWTRNVLPLCSLLVCGLVINAFLFSSGIKSFPACVCSGVL